MVRSRQAASTFRRHSCLALLLRRVVYAENETILTLFTPTVGKISALARRARSNGKRSTLHLDAIHTLAIVVDEPPGTDQLWRLRQASFTTIRSYLVTDLARLQAAGEALRWVRHMVAPAVSEPTIWLRLNELLDHLNEPVTVLAPPCHLAYFALNLWALLGYAWHFATCAQCNRTCEPHRPGFFDPQQGGLRCQSCGGGPFRLDASTRSRLARAQHGGPNTLQSPDADLVLAWIKSQVSSSSPAALRVR